MENVKRGFKRKTIEKTIKSKMAEWIATLPEDLREPVNQNFIVTGGAIASMLLGDLPNDFDVYFKDVNVAVKVAEHYIKQLTPSDRVSRIEVQPRESRVCIMIKSEGIATDEQDFEDYRYFESCTPAEIEEYFEKHYNHKEKSYNAMLISTNAITLHDGIQIIMRFTGDPNEIHKNFDFVHCTNWYTQANGLVLNQPALESLLSRELRYVGSLYPVCSLFRIKKFIKRGWSITAGEQLKIAYDVSHLDLDDAAVLQEQLIGVDYAYFSQILSLLKAREQIDRTYLYECIQRVFDNDEFNEIEEE